MKKSYSMFGLFSLIIVALVTVFLGFVVFEDGLSNPIPWIILAALALIPYLHERGIRKEYIDWSPQYEVGIELIDSDHQKLVGLLNQVVTAAHYHMGVNYVDNVLGELIDYTKYHFEREEGLMESNNYPDMAAHKEQHREMVAKVAEFQQQLSGEHEEVLSENVHAYLKDWLINHITHTDKELGKYLTTQGVQ